MALWLLFRFVLRSGEEQDSDLCLGVGSLAPHLPTLLLVNSLGLKGQSTTTPQASAAPSQREMPGHWSLFASRVGNRRGEFNRQFRIIKIVLVRPMEPTELRRRLVSE